MINVVKTRERQRRLQQALEALSPNFTGQAGSSSVIGGSASPVKRFRIVDLDEAGDTTGDWLICRPWDGEIEGNAIRPRVQSPGRCSITSGGLMTREETDWVELGVLEGDRVQILDAMENGDPRPEANLTYEITSVTASTITLMGWALSGTIDANFKVGPDTTLVAKPFLLRRTPFDTVAIERVESPPPGVITGTSLAGVDWIAAGVLDTDRVQIINATMLDDDNNEVELLDDSYSISSVSSSAIVLSDWPHGDATGDFRVGPEGNRLPRNGIEYLYEDHVSRTAKVLVEDGEDPGARERQQVTPDFAVGEEVFAVPFPYVGHPDDPAGQVLWLAVSNTHAWAQRDA